MQRVTLAATKYRLHRQRRIPPPRPQDGKTRSPLHDGIGIGHASSSVVTRVFVR